MTLQQLNYVITISECGSLNKAAEILYVAQPSLTGAVKELEKELGITIFNRTRQGSDAYKRRYGISPLCPPGLCPVQGAFRKIRQGSAT